MRTRIGILWFVFIFCILLFSSCENRISTDSAAHLTFSVDTLCFDTVFTKQGSATRIVMIYNRQKETVKIESVGLTKNGHFRINLDGEGNIDNLQNIMLRGGDSLFMFVRATINPQDSSSPVLVEDSVIFRVNGNLQKLILQAYGQDVIILRRDTLSQPTNILGGSKPYLVFDTIIAEGHIQIAEGTTFYMHDNAVMFFRNGLQVNGTKDKPVVFRGDRFDNLLYDIPYDYASGKWGGLFLINLSDNPQENPTYELNYLDIRSGMFGLFCQSNQTQALPTLTMHNCRLHNFSSYGLVVQNMDADVVNTEISNCADYCVYLSGGKHSFIHNTIVNFFNSKKENVSVHSVGRKDVPAVYISDLSKNQVRTEAIFINNIISGWREQNITLATALPDRYDGIFAGNFLRNDTLNTNLFPFNGYQQEKDTVFLRTYFSRDEHTYYDFSLDSVSPARDIADIESASLYPLDRNGNNRLQDGKPDAGCYEWLPNK